MNDDIATAGKRWRLRRLADADGFFAMVAIDQRPPIFATLARAAGTTPDRVPFAEVLAAKRLLAEAFAPAATAMLVDPNWGYPAAADLLNPAAGLLLTLEDHRTTPDRRSSLIADWSVDKIRALGGDAVKLLAWYHPRADAAVRAHQQEVVQRVGEDCARAELPFVLELLLYPLTSDRADDADAYRDDPAKHADEVLASVEAFADARYRVDLFKLESPLPPAQVPAPGEAGDAACAADFAALGRACGGRPWVMLSAGAQAADFERVVGYAARAGAAGFLAGRALWADGLALWPDRAAVAQQLAGTGRARLAALHARLRAEGRPWRPRPWSPSVAQEGDFARAR
jgi:tagatose 1,6-diphosphate aldolase